MNIVACENHGKVYLKLMDVDTTKKSKKRLVKSLGPLEKYDDGKPDYVKRLRESFRAGDPLIPELKAYVPGAKENKKDMVEYEEGSDDCIQETYLYSHKFLERIFEALDISEVTRTYKNRDGVTYDVYGFIRLLLCGRILSPASKIATVKQNDNYYDGILRGEFDRFDVYDTLSFLDRHKGQYLARVNAAVEKAYPRDGGTVLYDVTNFYFETEEPRGEDDMRQFGVSKERRKQPITQLGLFADGNGIPMGYGLFKGNTLDAATFRDCMKENGTSLPDTRFVLIGDRGMFSYKNVTNVLASGNGYIVSRSILKSKKKEREWMYDPEGYEGEDPERFKHKSRVVEKKVKGEDGKEIVLREKVVVYWSKKEYDRCLKENASFLAFVDEVLDKPHMFRITSQQNKFVKNYLKKNEAVNVKTGEIVNSSDLRLLLDEEKVAALKRDFGYFQIVTSETDMPDEDVIAKYHGLKQIEDAFRVMKGTLDLRPVYVWTPEHISGHVLVCVIALIVIRLIQLRVRDLEEKNSPEKPDPGEKIMWSYGISADRVSAALNRFTVGTVPGDRFIFQNAKKGDLKRILDAYGIKVPRKLQTRASLKKLKTSMDVFGK